jgi:hypothetical protein
LGSVWNLNLWPQLKEQVFSKDPCRLGFGPPHTGHLPPNTAPEPTGGAAVVWMSVCRFTVYSVRACGSA